ncbi:MAG TPA: leucyl aminopeptidase [Pirellulales bacterium]|jgi:leucyl aminopeptidase|nr:leucyl aminopeptidase [Pirellulales bacterium]
MKITAPKKPIAELAADVVVLGLYENGPLSAAATEFNRATGGLLERLLGRDDVSGKRYQMTTLLAPPGIAAPQAILIGLGERAKLDAGVAFRAAAAAAKAASAKSRKQVAFFLDDGTWPAPLHEQGIAGILFGSEGQDLYRAEKKQFPFGEAIWSGADKSALATGAILGESVNLARHLVNEPPQELYPESFAEHAVAIAKECGLSCEVWDQKRLEKERCGSLLAVARGSSRPPRLVILRHNGSAKKGPLLALVGKGVTFDSGGLSLKPSDSMLTMKMDMSGAAAVLGAMHAIAKLKLPIQVVGLMGLVENMTGPAAYKLGDVLTARNGRTIEVHNTDAEGRLVLADVLCVAVEQKPAKIIDLATLTGACVVALGLDVAGLMTNDAAWCETISAAATRVGEPAWQLPMFPEFGEQIKSEVADIKNVGEGRWGGAITAAKFLEEFVNGTPWTHLDIAGPAFAEKPKPWIGGGGTGCFVRTLVEVARHWK